MLRDDQLARLRQALDQRLTTLAGLSGQRRDASATVELDQTRTGRLSRMDALQGQAMARATEARSIQEIHRIQAALQRMEQGDYGICPRCDGPIAFARLQADPATVLCIDCAAAAETR